MDIKQQFKEKPLATIGAVVGVIGGIIGIIAAADTALTRIDEYIASMAELQVAKEEVIAHIRKEAVITRDVIVGEILIRKNQLNDDLEEAETEGEIARILQHIKELNGRLDMIRGIDR